MKNLDINKIRVMLTIELLYEGGIDNWSGYEDAIHNYLDRNKNLTREDLINDDVLILEAFEEGGVKHWANYEDSLKEISEYCEYLENEDSPDDPYDYENFFKFIDCYDGDIDEDASDVPVFEYVTKGTERVSENKRNIKHLNLYNYIEKKYPDYSCDDLTDIYYGVIEDEDGIFSNHISIQYEIKSAKAEAIASGKASIKDFKEYGTNLLIKYLIDNKKIDLFIKKHLAKQNKIIPKYISFIKVSSNGNIISSANSVEVVSSGRFMITVEPNNELNKYLMKMKKLPVVFNDKKYADKNYIKELEKVKSKLSKQEFNIKLTRIKLGINDM